MSDGRNLREGLPPRAPAPAALLHARPSRAVSRAETKVGKNTHITHVRTHKYTRTRTRAHTHSLTHSQARARTSTWVHPSINQKGSSTPPPPTPGFTVTLRAYSCFFFFLWRRTQVQSGKKRRRGGGRKEERTKCEARKRVIKARSVPGHVPWAWGLSMGGAVEHGLESATIMAVRGRRGRARASPGSGEGRGGSSGSPGLAWFVF